MVLFLSFCVSVKNVFLEKKKNNNTDKTIIIIIIIRILLIRTV